MPRFHFEIVNGHRIEDPVGLDCSSIDQAREVAESIARQIAIDVGETPKRRVLVVDEDGSEIHETAVRKPS